ncbi:alpha/beta fold hydrolase [Gordonia jinhuaensis]|uniref:Lipase n=1 Tax=Gordonia jinhuaensis TaxID=1517702 RepID=A0A916WTE7_9ACTN|nr:alpha/beta fold hydrolase [Gordonia jinhuaensis]GGB28219.1 lipase [Gordonia jinhuaensis]
MRATRLVSVAASVIAACSVLALSGGTAGAAPSSTSVDPVGSGPVQTAFRTAATYPHPEAIPPGANDWSCKPSAEHPRPVVLVHGTWESAYQTWAALAPKLKAQGFCVFAPNVGILSAQQGGGIQSLQNGGQYGAGPVAQSAVQLGAFVDRVLAATGAKQVDMVGHSQGGTMIRQYLKFDGGADAADPSKNKVRKVVTLVATNHGTTSNGLSSVRDALNALHLDSNAFMIPVAGYAGTDQQVGSPFITALNKGGDTFSGIDYTVLSTRYDEYTTPYYLTFLKAGPGATVHNILVQDGCEQDITDHTTFTYDPRVISYTERALGISTPVVCAPRAWYFDN